MEFLVVAASPTLKAAAEVLSTPPDGAGPVAQDEIRAMVARERLAASDVNIYLTFMVMLEKQQLAELSTFNAKFPAFFNCRIFNDV